MTYQPNSYYAVGQGEAFAGGNDPVSIVETLGFREGRLCKLIPLDGEPEDMVKNAMELLQRAARVEDIDEDLSVKIKAAWADLEWAVRK